MTAVELATRILVVLHLIGLSSLLGGFLTQMKDLKTGGRYLPGNLVDADGDGFRGCDGDCDG